ncbi:MAG: hypothetical protein FRX49_09688 [Trebouxia sp. A1-2]|nr:MAG: hypothetical protein FRX49_09688 [Trebouxia sp. A1-2]
MSPLFRAFRLSKAALRAGKAWSSLLRPFRRRSLASPYSPVFSASRLVYRLIRLDVRLGQVTRRQNLGADRQQGLVWPGAEPVNGAAVDEGGEHAAASSEGTPDWAHGQHTVQVVPHPIFPELCEAIGLGELQLLTGTATQGSSKAREALLAAAADSHKQCIAPRLAQHPSDAGDVVHSILEEDQAHGLAAAAVVVLQKTLQCLYQLGLVHNLKGRDNGKHPDCGGAFVGSANLLIGPFLRVQAWLEEAAKDDAGALWEQLLRAAHSTGQVFAHQLPQDVSEMALVLVINEAVECVVALGRGGQQLSTDSVVRLNCRGHNGSTQGSHISWPVCQEASQDGGEDGFDGCIRGGHRGSSVAESLKNGNLTLMSEQGSNRWRGGKYLEGTDLVVQELTQQLHGRLGAKFLPGRHVHIIHKEHQLLAHRGVTAVTHAFEWSLRRDSKQAVLLDGDNAARAAVPRELMVVVEANGLGMDEQQQGTDLQQSGQAGDQGNVNRGQVLAALSPQPSQAGVHMLLKQCQQIGAAGLTDSPRQPLLGPEQRSLELAQAECLPARRAAQGVVPICAGMSMSSKEKYLQPRPCFSSTAHVAASSSPCAYTHSQLGSNLIIAQGTLGSPGTSTPGNRSEMMFWNSSMSADRNFGRLLSLMALISITSSARLQSSASVPQAYPESILDSEELLSHHTQHLNVNPVELIKAGPGARLCQASKELAHEAVVQPLSTVEHHTVHAQGFAQGSSEGDVAAISHRSDHQTPLSSHIFVPIDKPDTVWQRSSDQAGESSQLGSTGQQVLGQRSRGAWGRQALLHPRAPSLYLADEQHKLAGVLGDPLGAGLAGRDLLALRRHHGKDVRALGVIPSKLQAPNAVKALAQLIIGQEVEAREGHALGFQMCLLRIMSSEDNEGIADLEVQELGKGKGWGLSKVRSVQTWLLGKPRSIRSSFLAKAAMLSSKAGMSSWLKAVSAHV